MKVLYGGQALLPWRQTKSHKETRAVSGLIPVIQNFNYAQIFSLWSCLSTHQQPAPPSTADQTGYNLMMQTERKLLATHEETIVFCQL